eukprot:2751326-Rhodomonas_salina.4
MSGTDLAYAGGLEPHTSELPGLLSPYPRAGTDLVDGIIFLRACYAMTGTDPVYGGKRLLCNVRYWPTRVQRDARY